MGAADGMFKRGDDINVLIECGFHLRASSASSQTPIYRLGTELPHSACLILVLNPYCHGRLALTPRQKRQEMKMDWSSIEQNWKSFQQRIREKWERLSDEDLNTINGQRDQLEQKIQTRYGFAPDYVHNEVDEWLRWQNSTPTGFNASRHAL